MLPARRYVPAVPGVEASASSDVKTRSAHCRMAGAGGRRLRRRLRPAAASLLAVLLREPGRVSPLTPRQDLHLRAGPSGAHPGPPTVMASADLEGGSRLYGQLADSDPGMR